MQLNNNWLHTLDCLANLDNSLGRSIPTDNHTFHWSASLSHPTTARDVFRETVGRSSRPSSWYSSCRNVRRRGDFESEWTPCSRNLFHWSEDYRFGWTISERDRRHRWMSECVEQRHTCWFGGEMAKTFARCSAVEDDRMHSDRSLASVATSIPSLSQTRCRWVECDWRHHQESTGSDRRAYSTFSNGSASSEHQISHSFRTDSSGRFGTLPDILGSLQMHSHRSNSTTDSCERPRPRMSHEQRHFLVDDEDTCCVGRIHRSAFDCCQQWGSNSVGRRPNEDRTRDRRCSGKRWISDEEPLFEVEVRSEVERDQMEYREYTRTAGWKLGYLRSIGTQWKYSSVNLVSGDERRHAHQTIPFTFVLVSLVNTEQWFTTTCSIRTDLHDGERWLWPAAQQFKHSLVDCCNSIG